MTPPTTPASETPRTDALINEGPFCGLKEWVVLWDKAIDSHRSIERELSAAIGREEKLRDERDNLLGINAAWARDHAGEKERGDAWMADCKAAEQAAHAFEEMAENERGWREKAEQTAAQLREELRAARALHQKELREAERGAATEASWKERQGDDYGSY